MVRCARCGKGIPGCELESARALFQTALSYGLFSEYADKDLCGSCKKQLLDSKGINYRGFFVYKWKTEGLKRIQELTKDLKTCNKCGYFEEVRHDIGGADSSGIVYDGSYSTYKCSKFGFDLDEKQYVIGQKCSSYISKEDYQNRCLSGEMDKDKAKENVQVVLDFSSLRDVLSRGGLVMSAYNCPNCNAMIDIPETGRILICKFCGTPIKAVDIFDRIKSLIQ